MRVLLAAALVIAAASASVTSAPASASRSAAGGAAAARPIPVLAYYYIWFHASSWNRAKIDYPLIGRYSSDDVAVMREQVRLAKQAGITGFLVSWKDTPELDRRLARLRAVAAAAKFKLAIMFEGLDFHRQPLPMAQVRRSFRYFGAHYAKDPVFNIFGTPLVAWSGTWKFGRAQMAPICRRYRSRLTILATDKQPASYQAVADLFRGDAYYWSSVDPLRTPGYAGKLDEFSAVIHRRHDLWIAPAAPGFNARLVGGSRVIPRRGGRTLRLAMNAAMRSSPDAIGLISWNEYSENSEVEPSRRFGATALDVIASIEHTRPPAVRNFDSSNPSGFAPGPSQFVILGILAALMATGIAAITLRR